MTIDFESWWSTDHTLSKMLPMVYCMHPATQIISCAIKVDNHPTDVVFGEAEIRRHLHALDWSNKAALAHNMSGFDAMLLRWRFGIKPKMHLCTLAMARPLHAKTTGLSLAKLVQHYGLGIKDNTALLNTKGKRLEDFTETELAAMAKYNKDDTEQCYALFHKLAPHYNLAELWQIDATVRMLVQPKFVVDTALLNVALTMERDQKLKHLLGVYKMLRAEDRTNEDIPGDCGDPEEYVRERLASAPKFAALLTRLGVEVPMKPSPTDPTKQVPALAKTDEAFVELQEHGDPVVAAATRARLAVKSTILETRIEAFLETARYVGGRLPVPLHYSGADTTGRWSGWAFNPQNLNRINPTKPKVSDALRNCMRAPKGHAVVVADLSGIELRVNHFLWKVPSSMRLYRDDPAKADLYVDFASRLYNVAPHEVTKAQRQIGKVAHLGLGYGAGPATFRRIAKNMGGVNMPEEEAASVTYSWREEYAPIVQGWRTCHNALAHVYSEQVAEVDPWGLVTTCKEGLRLPSGRLIRYPALRSEVGEDGKEEWWYGEGRHKTRIYAGKVTENAVQSLARDIIAANALTFYKATGLRPVLSVHDELVYVVPQAQAEDTLHQLQEVMRTPPTWWPELITWSEGGVGESYGAVEK